MARKRKRFGLVRHSAKKASRMYYEREHTGKEQHRRMLNVNVTITRGSRPTNMGRTAGFWGSACFGYSKSKGPRYKKCGPHEFARTPTLAAKKALVALGKARDVK